MQLCYSVQAFVSVNWLLSEEHIDLETELAWGFLDYLMLGTTASPLRRALTESGLGESIIGGGLSDELRQPTFSLGLKGVDPANAQKVCLPLACPSPCSVLPSHYVVYATDTAALSSEAFVLPGAENGTKL